jgi:hypothetical protein
MGRRGVVKWIVQLGVGDNVSPLSAANREIIHQWPFPVDMWCGYFNVRHRHGNISGLWHVHQTWQAIPQSVLLTTSNVTQSFLYTEQRTLDSEKAFLCRNTGCTMTHKKEQFSNKKDVGRQAAFNKLASLLIKHATVWAVSFGPIHPTCFIVQFSSSWYMHNVKWLAYLSRTLRRDVNWLTLFAAIGGYVYSNILSSPQYLMMSVRHFRVSTILLIDTANLLLWVTLICDGLFGEFFMSPWRC